MCNVELYFRILNHAYVSVSEKTVMQLYIKREVRAHFLFIIWVSFNWIALMTILKLQPLDVLNTPVLQSRLGGGTKACVWLQNPPKTSSP